MSCRFTSSTSRSAVALLVVWPSRADALGCSEVRGRKRDPGGERAVQARALPRGGRHVRGGGGAGPEPADAVAEQGLHLPAADRARRPRSREPARRRLRAGGVPAARTSWRPSDPRAEQLTVQTWFDTDDFATLEKTFLERDRARPNDYDVVHGLQEVYYKWGKWPQALEWSTRAAALRPNDAEAQYGVGTFIWQVLAARGGGPDMAAYDPRPRPAPEDAQPTTAHGEAQGNADEPEMVPPPPPPADAARRRDREGARRAGRPGDRASREGGGAAPALRRRDDVPRARVAAEVVRGCSPSRPPGSRPSIARTSGRSAPTAARAGKS